MAPAPVPSVPKDARAAAMRFATSTAEANDRLQRSREWYEGVKDLYAKP